MTQEFKKGDQVRIFKAARHHQVGNFISSDKCVPEENAFATVRKITKTKNGRKMHVNDDRGYGYAVMIDNLPEFMAVSII